MSGFEIVGVVLAAPPLIISALRAYNESLKGVRRLFAWEAELSDLILSLNLQDCKFRLNLLKLIKAAVPEADSSIVDGRKTDIFWNGDVGGKVEAYLGPAYQSFRCTVVEYEQCLKRIVRKLKNVNRPKKVS